MILFSNKSSQHQNTEMFSLLSCVTKYCIQPLSLRSCRQQIFDSNYSLDIPLIKQKAGIMTTNAI